ncbi:MAG: efflux RND transporter periplasmic adaptor subunit [Deltaproteobacteria bacterium]|nr:efflux RND transporter periplasmic adaptor subunit [Deltaproteobacteria bacterium]MBW2416734.1 efflux RND transporter periplasmic adaptor subunit [Deltaproteobacteria bacterium]
MTDPNGDPADDPRKRWLGIGAATVGFLLVGLVLVPGLARYRHPVAVAPADGSAATGAEAPAPNTGWLLGRAEEAPIAAEVAPSGTAFDCMIGPNKVIDIGSPITGLIEEIVVERSEYVEENQVLARLESSVEEAAVRVAQARAQRKVEVEFSRANLGLGEKRRDRAVELYESRSLSLDQREEVETRATLAALELEQAQEDQRLARLQLDQAVAALGRRTVRSPIAGYVVERLMDAGEVVDEETMLRVAQIDPLRVDVILPSHWFGRIHPGSRAEVVPEAPLDDARSAEVSIVDRVIDGASGTFSVRLELPNPSHDLPAGLRCQVRFADADD